VLATSRKMMEGVREILGRDDAEVTTDPRGEQDAHFCLSMGQYGLNGGDVDEKVCDPMRLGGGS